jgi:MazG family protein
MLALPLNGAQVTTSTSTLDPVLRDDGRAIQRLVDIMARLRTPGTGCPWDLEQTLESLRPYLVEEAFEVLEAIDTGAVDDHRQELGDLLLQVVFQSRVREEQGLFGLAHVADAISEKMLRRHPHVFGEATARSADEVAVQWAKLKEAERRTAEKPHPSALDGVPKALPALVRSERLGEKAARTGFDWRTPEEVRSKIDEELREVEEAIAEGDRAHVEEELGDLLFAVAQYARKCGVHPEDALRLAAAKFERRFRRMETTAVADGRVLSERTFDELDALWNRCKAAG